MGKKLTIVEEVRAEIGEASAVVPLGARRFLVADDEGGVVIVDASASTGSKAKARTSVLLDAGDDDRVAGLEGMCLVGGDRVVAVREHDGGIVSFGIPRGRAKRIELVEHPTPLQRPPGSPAKKNKGWEGIAHMTAGAAFDKRSHLIAVHEGKPRAVGVFAYPGFQLQQTIAVTGEIADLLPDLSDVAVHGKTGELWLLSDEGERVVRAKLGKTGLSYVDDHALPVDDGEKPEGIAFDDGGALWLVTDDSGRLLRLA